MGPYELGGLPAVFCLVSGHCEIHHALSCGCLTINQAFNSSSQGLADLSGVKKEKKKWFECKSPPTVLKAKRPICSIEIALLPDDSDRKGQRKI